MINQTVNILNIFILLFYVLSFSSYFLDFKNDNQFFKNSKRIFLFITILLHAIFIVIVTAILGHFPITNKFEIFSLIAFSIIFTYFLIELLTDIQGTGLFILAISLVFQVHSVFIFKLNPHVLDVLKTLPMGFHVSTAILSYSAFAISATYGILYLILFNKLKSNRFDHFFNKMPNLEVLEKLSFTAMSIGFILLTISILIGFIWLPTVFPEFRYTDPKIISTLLVWLVYGIGITTERFGRLYGKKLIWFSIVGFALIIIASMGTAFLTKSFHSFG